MQNTYNFSLYGGIVDQVYSLSDYEYAPQITPVGSVLSDIVYDSEYYSVQSNFEVPVISYQEGGTTYYSYPYVYYGPVYYVYDVPVVLHDQVLEEPVPEESWSEELSYGDRYSVLAGDVRPYAAPETTSEAVTSFELYYEEEGERLNDAPNSDKKNKKQDDDNKNDGDRKNEDDNGASSLGQKKNPDCVKESSAYKKFCSETEERRKLVGPPSQVQKTFINRGVVKDPSLYNNFCREIEDRMKKIGSSSPGNRDPVKESKNYVKFCNGVEARRKILDSSTVLQKSFVNRGIVADPSSYKKFCRSVKERIKNLESSETPPCGVKNIIDKEGSESDEKNSLKFMDMIMNSAEYLHVQDHIKNPKHYRDLLYRQSLKNNPRKNNAALLDILPSITEELFIFDDLRNEISCGDVEVIEPSELVSDEISKPKKRIGRWKSFRNWWSKKLFCCLKTKDPP